MIFSLIDTGKLSIIAGDCLFVKAVLALHL